MIMIHMSTSVDYLSITSLKKEELIILLVINSSLMIKAAVKEIN
jgi:hypothetical protein